MNETCAICGCQLHRKGDYAKPTILGRSHATAHHHVAERFFGRSSNRKGTQREAMFEGCPWGHEREVVIFCFECHEELIHNPVILPDDIGRFAGLVRLRGLSEQIKTSDRSLIARRIMLFQEVIARGIEVVFKEELAQQPPVEATSDMSSFSAMPGTRAMNERRFPPGWDEERVRRLIAELDSRTEEEWIAADEAAMEEGDDQTVVAVPTALMPEIHRLLAAHQPE